MEFSAWLKTTAQVELNVLVCCHHEFAMHHILVTYSKLYHKDISLLLNKNEGLQFCFVQHRRNAQYLHHQKPWYTSLLSCIYLDTFTLAMVLKMFSIVLMVIQFQSHNHTPMSHQELQHL
jgi:hypothetical protein